MGNEKSFKPAWDRVREKFSGSYNFFSDGLFVESIASAPLTHAIKRDDGSTVTLHLASGENKQYGGLELGKAVFVKVLDVGAGYYDEDGKDVPLEYLPGDILLVAGPESVKWWTNILGIVQQGEHKVGTMKESEILMKIKDEETFRAMQETLKEAIDV